MATAGCLLVRFVYCMEIIHINSRTAAGMVNNIFVSIGFSTLSLLGYLIRDWRYLMLAVSLPGAPLLMCWWYVSFAFLDWIMFLIRIYIILDTAGLYSSRCVLVHKLNMKSVASL